MPPDGMATAEKDDGDNHGVMGGGGGDVYGYNGRKVDGDDDHGGDFLSFQFKVVCNQRGVNDFITSIKEALGGHAREGKVEHTRQRYGVKESLKAKRTVCTLRDLHKVHVWVLWLELVFLKDADPCALGSLIGHGEG